MVIIKVDDFENYYEISDDLGSGQFAVVKRVKELSSGIDYAAKFVRKKRCIAGKRGLKREEILREADILSQLNHRNIITLHDVFENKHEIILVLELVGAGELFHYIAEKDALTEEEAVLFILQILEGVHHMHEKHIVHLDLKPENVMLLEKNKTHLKIIDFGISRQLKPNEPTKETFGTPEFVAPEVIAFEPLTLATDMWSIGVITYILLSGASPFLGNTNQETFTNISQVDYRFDEEFFSHTSDLAKDFIQRLFIKNPRERATVEDCLNHPWIKPRRKQDEEERRHAQINMPSFKSFIARRRWKVQMHCESRILRTVTTKYTDRDGNVKSKKCSERKGKTAIYEGQYSETDSEDEGTIEQTVLNKQSTNEQQQANGNDRIRCCPQNIELRQVKSSEFAESFQEDEEGEDDYHSKAEQKSKPSPTTLIKPLPNEQVVSDQHSRAQTNDCKIIESIDEQTGENVRHTIQNKVQRDENLKMSKSDDVQYEETDEGLLKKRCVKAISLCNKIFRQSQMRLSSALSLDALDSTFSPNRTCAENDDDFVLTALLCAAEDGDFVNIKKLCNIATIDINKENKHGETALHFACGSGHFDIVKFLCDRKANLFVVDGYGNNGVYWAARQGYVQIITFLYEKGVPIDLPNRTNETSLHISSRYGHAHVVEYLCKLGANVDAQEDEHETPLMCATWHGYPRIVRILCNAGCDINLRNKEGETGLILAAARGNEDIVRILIDNKANLNIRDKRSLAAIHWACKRQHIAIAIMLINADCNMNILDMFNETPLHYASREGLLTVVQTLCAFGCHIGIRNKSDSTALHLAARLGHTEIVRCLCLAGLNLTIQDKDGRTAAQIAEINGKSDIVNLLKSLSMQDNRQMFIEQLVPTKEPLRRIKLKVFGNSDAGKTTLIESLQCSYINSFFRRSRLGSSKKPLPVLSNRNSMPADELSRTPDLTIKLPNENSSKGISVYQVPFTGGGQWSVWDFSGMAVYRTIYDHFIGDHNCLHMIVFDITDDENKCVQNLTYWLEFLRVRILIREPIGLNGQSSEMVKIILVGTHADQILNCPKDENGDYVCEKATIVFNRIKDNYQYDFDFHDKLYLLDARSAWTSNIKNVIQCFNSYKDKICEKLKPSTMFLNRCTYHLQQWRKTYASFPVMSWSRFVENIRTELNPLASDEHMKELVQQLQLMGEILYLEGDPHQDLVCFDPHWLCHTILGKLLTSNYDIKKNILNNINKVKSKQQRFLSGTYSINDIQTLFPDTDALDLLQIFCAFDLCVQYDVYGDIEYEFPQLNSVDIIPGLWEKRSGVNYVYIGCEIRCRTNNELLWPIFSRIQVQLRRLTMSHEFQQQYKNEDIELYQSRCGSKLICGMIELLFTANHPTHLELKSRGQPNERENIFYLFHEILTLIEQTYLHTCPSLQLEYHYISTKHLQLNLTPLLNLFYQNSEVISKRPLQMSTSSIFITDQNLPSPTMSTYSLPFASNNNDTIFNTINQFTSPFYYTFSPKSIIQIQMNKSHEDNSIQPVTDANNNRKSILNDHHQIESPDDDSSSLLIKDTTGEYQEDLIDLICCGSYDLYSNLEMGVDLSISTLSLVTRQLLCRLFDKQDSIGRDWCLLAIALSMQHLIPLLDTEDLYKSKTEQLLDELCRKRSTDANIKYLLEKFLDIDRKDAYDLVAYTCPLFKLPQIQPVTDQITDPHDSHDSGIQNSTNTIASINR